MMFGFRIPPPPFGWAEAELWRVRRRGGELRAPKVARSCCTRLAHSRAHTTVTQFQPLEKGNGNSRTCGLEFARTACVLNVD